MPWETIRKGTAPGVTPNLADFDQACSDSPAYRRAPRWPVCLAAYKAVSRHAGAGHGDKVAVRCIARDNAIS